MKAINYTMNVFFFALLSIQVVYAATDRVGGSGSTINDIITTTAWTTLHSVSHTVSGTGANDCMVVASANAITPFGAADGPIERLYTFAVCRNSSSTCSPSTGSSRVLSFVANPGIEDHNFMPISVNTSFTGLTATNGLTATGLSGGPIHTFYFVGRKNTNEGPWDLEIDSNRIDFVCVDRD